MDATEGVSTARMNGGLLNAGTVAFHRAEKAQERGEGICRTCLAPIWDEGGTVGHRRRDEGWSDRIERGGDSLVCFSAVEYRHVPLTGREACVYDQAYKRAVADERQRIAAEIEASMPPSTGYISRDTYLGMCDAYRHCASIVAGSVPIPGEQATCEHGSEFAHPWLVGSPSERRCPGPSVPTGQEAEHG